MLWKHDVNGKSGTPFLDKVTWRHLNRKDINIGAWSRSVWWQAWGEWCCKFRIKTRILSQGKWGYVATTMFHWFSYEPKIDPNMHVFSGHILGNRLSPNMLLTKIGHETNEPVTWFLISITCFLKIPNKEAFLTYVCVHGNPKWATNESARFGGQCWLGNHCKVVATCAPTTLW